MTKYKVGDRLKVLGEDCSLSGQEVVVTAVGKSTVSYEALDGSDACSTTINVWRKGHELTFVIKTLENLDVGDRVSNPGVSYFRTIKAKLEDIYFVQDSTDEVISMVTADMLKERGWMPLVDDDEPDYQEMTVEEVSKLVGKTVKIVEKA